MLDQQLLALEEEIIMEDEDDDTLGAGMTGMEVCGCVCVGGWSWVWAVCACGGVIFFFSLMTAHSSPCELRAVISKSEKKVGDKGISRTRAYIYMHIHMYMCAYNCTYICT